jgi:uncharacterized membrane protein YcaP (DUF421 family)
MIRKIMEVALRSASAYILLLVFGRIIGRKLISRITLFDFVVGVTLGSIAVRIALGSEESPFLAALSVIVISILVVITDYLDIKSINFRKLVDGEPIVLISNGRILDYNLKKVKISINNLMSQLREKDIFNVDDVAIAAIESDGELTVLPKPNKRQVTTGDLNISASYNVFMNDVIIDGKIMNDNLKRANHDDNWLRNQLKKQQIIDVNQVFYAGLSSEGNLYISMKSKK